MSAGDIALENKVNTIYLQVCIEMILSFAPVVDAIVTEWKSFVLSRL